MIPRKLTHGDKFSTLFNLWNSLIDYLHRSRAVSGNGMRISRNAAGTLFEVICAPGASSSVSSAPPESGSACFGSFLVSVVPPENNPEAGTAKPPEKLAITQGYANVNGWMFDIPESEIDISELAQGESLLCLKAEIKGSEIPEPKVCFLDKEKISGDFYPLARISKGESGEIKISQYPISVAVFMLVKKCLYAQAAVKNE